MPCKTLKEFVERLRNAKPDEYIEILKDETFEEVLATYEKTGDWLKFSEKLKEMGLTDFQAGWCLGFFKQLIEEDRERQIRETQLTYFKPFFVIPMSALPVYCKGG